MLMLRHEKRGGVAVRRVIICLLGRTRTPRSHRTFSQVLPWAISPCTMCFQTMNYALNDFEEAHLGS